MFSPYKEHDAQVSLTPLLFHCFLYHLNIPQKESHFLCHPAHHQLHPFLFPLYLVPSPSPLLLLQQSQLHHPQAHLHHHWLHLVLFPFSFFLRHQIDKELF